MMKIGLIIIMYCFALLLYGCNDQNDEETYTQEDTEALENLHANERTDVENSGVEEVNALTQYKQFKLSISYEVDRSFEVNYMYKDPIVAELNDDVNSMYLSGEEAKNYLIKSFGLLNFDANTDESEIVIQLLTAFQLSDDFKTIALVVEHHTGTIKTYKITN